MLVRFILTPRPLVFKSTAVSAISGEEFCK